MTSVPSFGEMTTAERNFNYPISLDEYCKEIEHTKDTVDFREFIEKQGFQYDIATRANWDYRYECFEDEVKEMIKMKKEDSFLGRTQKLLKELYDKGASIEYEEDEGKWVDLPKGLPVDFSKFDEGKIRLKFGSVTHEQIVQFMQDYGIPTSTDWEYKNIPLLAFCYTKGFCKIILTESGNHLVWDALLFPDLQRFFENKELDENYTTVETEEQNTRKEMVDSIEKEIKYVKDTLTIKTFMDIVNYVKWEFQNINEKIEDLYARTEE